MLKEGINKLMHSYSKKRNSITGINRSIMDNVNALADEVKERRIQSKDAADKVDSYLNDLLAQSGIEGIV